jgi:hypothetical protein
MNKIQLFSHKEPKLPSNERKALYKKLNDDNIDATGIQKLWDEFPYKAKRIYVMFFVHPHTPENIINQIDIVDTVKGDVDLIRMLRDLHTASPSAQRTLLNVIPEFNLSVKKYFPNGLNPIFPSSSSSNIGVNKANDFLVISLLVGNCITISEWFHFLQRENYVNDFANTLVVNKIVEYLEKPEAKQELTEYLKSEYDLNIEGYSVDMIRSLLNEENNFKLI